MTQINESYLLDNCWRKEHLFNVDCFVKEIPDMFRFQHCLVLFHKKGNVDIGQPSQLCGLIYKTSGPKLYSFKEFLEEVSFRDESRIAEIKTIAEDLICNGKMSVLSDEIETTILSGDK